MKQSLGFGFLFLCVIYGAEEVWSRPLQSDELREERLAILRRIIEDMRELIYVNDLYEGSKIREDLDLDTYLNSISETTKTTDKRKVPGGLSAVRGKRPYEFSAVRGKRPHTFSAVRGKRDPRFFVPEGDFGNSFPDIDLDDDSNKRNAPAGFSFVRGKKDLSNAGMSQINEDEVLTDQHDDVSKIPEKKSSDLTAEAVPVSNDNADEQKHAEQMDFLFQG